MKNPRIDGWEIWASTSKDYTRMDRGWRTFALALFKWKKLPTPGERVMKEHYTGIFVRFAYWLPIESV